ncbi:MAG: hypothetical protein II273_08605 [Lachnospiraceae bacterium]|nr:hypothetical protein [Lachnospiraceae bacterium]MEE1257629.1 GDSL-type esterase/lipase family protein [Lachnospiraceae bacterium]
MNSIKHYILTFCILLSSLLFSLLGIYWNQVHYHEAESYSAKNPPLTTAMMGIHDGLLFQESDTSPQGNDSLLSEATATNITEETATTDSSLPLDISNSKTNVLPETDIAITNDLTSVPETYSFTQVTDDYFQDAVFIGDSRTVGISEYSGIENATFLCKTSLSIYDYTKPKITYKDKKTSIQEVLQTESFGKVYLMVGINECSYGTPESFYELYREVVEDIRKLQPEALIFIESNLLVTQSKSDSNEGITNESISSRNDLIATLANQKDTFYIDINQSSLCENGALIPEFTWDQIHIKAQYYTVWKDFLLDHGIVKNHTDTNLEMAKG